MTEQEIKKEQAEQNLIRAYPNIDVLCDATRASVLVDLLDRKDKLYNYPFPTIADINKIYHDDHASEKLLKRIITYLYALRENQAPSDTIARIHASNFYIACRKNTVTQLLCFVAEYPSMRQYSRGFDYSNFASRFKEYCNEWIDYQNRIIEAMYQEADRLSSLTTNKIGKENRLEYLRETYKKGVDLRKGGLYSYDEVFRKEINAIIGDNDISNPETTKEYYACQYQKYDEEVRERRKKLPVWLLSKKEIKEYAEETNKPF